MVLQNKKKLSKEIMVFVIVSILLITTVLVIKSNKEIKRLEQIVAEKNDLSKERITSNLQVEIEMERREKLAGNSEVIRRSEDFNNYFFDWNSWISYGENMEILRENYPSIDKKNIVDISGKIVGTGKSPISTHKSNYFTMENNNYVFNLLQQVKSNVSSETTTTWQIISELNEENLNIEKMKMYRPL